jgi:Kef-type K+ transport system membrane component KefB
MTILLWIVVGIFCLKIVWNFGVPYELLRRQFKKDPKMRGGGISMVTFVEVFLLILAIALSSIAQGDSWMHRPKNVALWGVLVLVASYVHFVLAGMLCGWLATKIKHLDSTPPSGPE